MKYLLSLLLIYSFTASANNSVIVNTFESENEVKSEFIERTARFIDTWTADNKVEICGLITERDSTYRVILTTNYSQLSCNMTYVTDGDTFTGDSIHSHPPVDNLGRIRVTRKTHEQDGDFVNGRSYVKISNHSFSLMDYRLGNGYLVVEGKLYYQHGLNTKTFVTNL